MMIDQIRQAGKNFEGTYQQYKILLKLTSNSDLQIKMKNQETNDQYFLLIDRPYIARSKHFQNLVEEPIDILRCFMNHFDNVSVENQQITLKYEYGTIRKLVKNFIFKTQKQIDKKLYSQEEVLKMRNKHINVINAKDQQISQFKTIIERNKKNYEFNLNQKAKLAQLLGKTRQQNLKLQQRLKQIQINYNQDLNKLTKQYKSIISRKNLVIQLLRIKQKIITKEVDSLKSANSSLQIENGQVLQDLNRIEAQKRAISQLMITLKMNRWVKIETIKPNQKNINIVGKIIQVKHKKKKILVTIGDETGVVDAFLDSDERLVSGNNIALLNADVSLYRQRIELTKAKVNLINWEMHGVNKKNNISQR